MASSRALTVAHNLRDAAHRKAIAEAMARGGATVEWREVGVDAAVQIRTSPPDVLLLSLTGPSLLERELLERLAREPREPPVPAVVMVDDPELIYVLPAHDVFEAPGDAERVAESLVTVGRRAQAWRGRNLGGLDRVSLSDTDFRRLADLVSRRAALQIENGAIQNVGEVVARRMRASAFREVSAYLSWLGREGQNHGELQKLWSGLVVGETSFFRTPAHFAALRNVVIPDLVARRPRGKLRGWSAGCSTGEEAYSLAITLREEVADCSPDRVEITATDIDRTALERARRGAFRAKNLRKVSPAYRDAAFVPLGDEFLVDTPVRELITFDWFNLNADWREWSRLFPDPLDLIFCENVIIYFRKDLIPPLLERFSAVLRPGGYLFLGYSETLYGVDHPFEDVTYSDTFFYRKPPKRTVVSAPAAPPPAIHAVARRRSTRLMRRSTDEIVRANARAKAAATADPTPAIAAPSSPAGFDTTLNAAAVAAADALADRKEEARDRLLDGDFDGAEIAYRAVLQADPKSRSTRLALAFLALKRDDPDTATPLLDAVATDHPLDPEVFYFRGLAAGHAGDRAAAREFLQRALYLDADFVPAHFQLGELASGESRMADAARHFRNAADAQSRAPAAAVVSLEGVVGEDDLTAVCEQNAAALAQAAGEERP